MQPDRLNNLDLVAAVVLALFMVPLVLVTSGPFSIAAGITFALVLPGYTLLAALFPRRQDLPALERFVLSLGLSLAALPLVGVVVSFSPWGIRLLPIVLLMTLVIVVSAGFGFYRRHRLAIESDWTIRLPSSKLLLLKEWRGQSRPEQAQQALFVLAGLGLLVTLLYVMVTPKITETFTEFYILGDTGKMDGYPGLLIPGRAANVTLGLINQEHTSMVYRIEVRIGDEPVAAIGPVELLPEQRWQREVEFRPTRPGTHQRVDFLLYRDRSNEPYRSLHLWIDVG